jgi:hypothetical protein
MRRSLVLREDLLWTLLLAALLNSCDMLCYYYCYELGLVVVLGEVPSPEETGIADRFFEVSLTTGATRRASSSL